MNRKYMYLYIYIYMVTRSAAPPHPPKWSGPSLLPSVVWGLVGGNPPPSFSPCGVGSCGWVGPGGWESPSFLPFSGGVWVGIPLPRLCGVGFGGGRVRARSGSLGGVESVVLPEWGFSSAPNHILWEKVLS